MTIDHTHDPKLASWVSSANGHPVFPIQNLPLGVFSPPGGEPRVGIAIGDSIFDMWAATTAGLFHKEAANAAGLCLGNKLNPLMAAPPTLRRALRLAVSALL